MKIERKDQDQDQDQVAELRRQRLEEAQQAAQKRREKLLRDVEDLVSASEHNPAQVGEYVGNLAAAGLLSTGDEERIHNHIATIAGREFADEAFMGPVGDRQRESDELLGALVDEWKSARARMERPQVGNVIDVDSKRAQKTMELVERIAGFLGLAAREIQVRADDVAAQKTAARGTRGLMDGGVVYLHPKTYDPETASGRGLLGHEMVHMAQRREHSGAPATISKPRAEAEAATLGRQFAAGQSIGRPQFGLPALDKAAERDATTDPDGGGASPPSDFKLSLAGQEFRIRIPSGSSPGRVRIQDLSIGVGPLTVTEADLRFSSSWELERGTIKATVSAGEGINIENVELTVNSRREITATLENVEIQLGTYISATMNLTIGRAGVSGTATIQPSNVNLPGGISFTGGQINLTVADGQMSADGTVTASVAGLGTLELSASLEQGGEEGTSVAGTISITLDENLQLVEGVTLNSATITGSYSDTEGIQTSGKVTVTVRDWATAEIDVAYKKGVGGEDGSATELWSATGRIDQLGELSVGEGEHQLTISEAFIEMAYVDNVMGDITAGATVTHAHFSGTLNGTYVVESREFGGTAEVTLTNEMPIGDTGVVLKVLAGSATVEANALTVIEITDLQAEIPYETQPTFKLTATNCQYRVPEMLFSGAGAITTMRELSFGAATGIHAVIAAEAEATVTITDNVITAVTSGIAYKILEGELEIGNGTLNLNFANENGQESVSGTGDFTLTTDLSFPDRALGPVKILNGATLNVTVTEGALAEISIENVGFEVKNWGEGGGKVEGSFDSGTWNVTDNLLSVSGNAAITEAWPLTATWGEVTFREGGDFGVVVTDNEVEKFHGELPFAAQMTVRGETIKLEGNLDGSYTKEDSAFTGSLDATLVENDLTITLGKGGDSIVIKKDVTTFGASVEASSLTQLTMDMGLEYHRTDGLFLAGSITEGTYDVETGDVGFQGELTLKKRIDQPLSEGGTWKIVILPDTTTVDITVEASALTRVGGTIQLELHENDTPLLRGSLNNAELNIEDMKFSGELSLELIEPFDFPRLSEDRAQLPTGLGLQVQAGSTVTGTITENSFATATIDLQFSVKEGGTDIGTGHVGGTWNLDTNKVTGDGGFTLTGDYVIGDGNGNAEEPAGWTLTIAGGSEVAIKVAANILQEATVDVSMKLKNGEEEVATGNINGQYKFGDEKGFSGGISIDMSKDMQIATAGRFGIFIGEDTSVSGTVEQGKVKTATGDFVLVAKEGVEKSMSLTINTTYNEGQPFEGTASIQVHKPILIGESGEWKFFLDEETTGNVAISGNEPKAIDGTISLRIAKNDEDFARAVFTIDYDFSQGTEANVTGTGTIELIGEMLLGTAAGYTFTLTSGTGVSASVTNNKLDWIDGTLGLKMGDPEEFGVLTITGKYDATTEEPKFNGEASLVISRSLDLNFEAMGFHFYLDPSTVTVTMTDSEISAANGTIVFRAEQSGGEGDEVLGNIVVTLQGDYVKSGETGTFNGTGTAVLTGNITIGNAGGYEFIVMTGTEVEIDVEDNEFTRIHGTLKGQVNNLTVGAGETKEFIGFECEVTYRTAEGGQIDVDGSCTLLGSKKLFDGPAGYEFWLVPGQGPSATIKIVANELIEVGGTVACEVRDGEELPLLKINATGTYVQATGLFSGSGDIKLGRDVTYPPDSDGFKLVFKAGSGGGGTVVDSEIEELTGNLKVEVHLEDGPLVRLDANGTYDAVNNNIVELSGSVTLLRVIEIGGTGENAFLRVEELSGHGRIENNKLVEAGGHCKVVLPKLNNLTGEFDVNWRDNDGDPKFSGSGKIDFTLFEDAANHRKMYGSVDGEYNEDGTFRIHGEVDFDLNEYISGKLDVEVDQDLDPILGGTITVSDVKIVEGRDLWGIDIDLFTLATTVAAGPVPVDIAGGCAFGMKLSMDDLTFGTSITVANWHPLTAPGNLPDIPEARIDLHTGLDLRAALKPWMSVGIGVSNVASAGVKLSGELALITELNLNPYLILRAVDGVYSGELGVNLEVVGSAELTLTPQIYARLGTEDWPYDLAEWKIPLGELFNFDWNAAYPFGDTSVSTTATADAAEGGGGAETITVPTETVEAGNARPAMGDFSATNTGGQVSGGPDMNSLDTTPEQEEGEASELQTKLAEAQEWASKITNIANVGGTLFTAISIMWFTPIPPPFGQIAAGIYMVYKHLSGECTFGDIKDAAVAVWEIAQELGFMDYITSLIPDVIVNMYNAIKDKSVGELIEDLVHTMAGWLRTAFPSWGRVVTAIEDALIAGGDAVGRLIDGLVNNNLSVELFLEIAASLGAAVGEIALAVAEELGEEALELLGDAAAAAGAAGRWLAGAAGSALSALGDLASDAANAVSDTVSSGYRSVRDSSYAPWNW